MLLRRSCTRNAQRGVGEARLHVNAEAAPALALYAMLGFTLEATVKGARAGVGLTTASRRLGRAGVLVTGLSELCP